MSIRERPLQSEATRPIEYALREIAAPLPAGGTRTWSSGQGLDRIRARRQEHPPEIGSAHTGDRRIVARHPRVRGNHAVTSPGYAPDLNPDELVWSHVKRTGTARRPLQKGEKLRDKIERQLEAIQRLPRLVRSFFKAPSVAYISDC